MNTRIWAATLCALLLAGSAAAQEQRGSIEGIVKDTSGAVLPGVTVEARSMGGAVVTATTDSDGAFRFPAVAPGDYEVTASLTGFTPQKFERVQVLLGQIKTLQFELSVAGVAETVQVTAESPLVDVRQSARATSIRTEQVDLLPKGRDYTNLVTQIAGANQETNKLGGISIDGASAGENKQAIVIDINDLHDRGKRFVVGSVVRRLVEQKEGRPRPLVFLVLDELNKYAPREGWSPIKEVILDIAERGRSLGVILVGAQQTASEIERRVTANASFRVAGRLDAAEASRGEYGFLTDAARARASILKPGTMFVHQPEIPVPLLTQFPFPSWATRQNEVDEQAAPAPGLRGRMQ